MSRLFTLLVLTCFSLVCYGQQTDSSTVSEEEDEGVIVKPDNSAPLKLGIGFGTGYSGMLGNELLHPIGRVSLQGGLYLRYRFKKNWGVHTGLGASFRGSNFNNGPSQYSSIRTYYLDVPVLFTYAFTQSQETLVVGGIQYSYLLNASMYVSTSSLPAPDPPGFNKNDLALVGGMQFNTPYVAFQLLLKYGLVNINLDQPWPIDKNNTATSPTLPANSGGSIHNFVFEINFLF
jgi:hypothetical protein